MKKFLWSTLLLTLTPIAANAVTITPTVSTTPGTLYQTAAITTDVTTNATMVGSVVTVTFQGGSTATAIWTSAGAVGTGWALTESGDTFDYPWTLTNSGATAITGFSFDGVAGNTTFDIVNGPEGTPASGNGKPFSDVTGPATLPVAALYTNELLVGGTFYGDEYTKLLVTFGGTGLTNGQTLSYYADTDNAMASSGITVAVSPEPSSFVLLGTGLVGMWVAGRRRVLGF